MCGCPASLHLATPPTMLHPRGWCLNTGCIFYRQVGFRLRVDVLSFLTTHRNRGLASSSVSVGTTTTRMILCHTGRGWPAPRPSLSKVLVVRKAARLLGLSQPIIRQGWTKPIPGPIPLGLRLTCPGQASLPLPARQPYQYQPRIRPKVLVMLPLPVILCLRCQPRPRQVVLWGSRSLHYLQHLYLCSRIHVVFVLLWGHLQTINAQLLWRGTGKGPAGTDPALPSFLILSRCAPSC
jgi:hypothetical protein